MSAKLKNQNARKASCDIASALLRVRAKRMDKKRWQSAALKNGLSLAAWVTRTLNSRALVDE